MRDLRTTYYEPKLKIHWFNPPPPKIRTQLSTGKDKTFLTEIKGNMKFNSKILKARSHLKYLGIKLMIILKWFIRNNGKN